MRSGQRKVAEENPPNRQHPDWAKLLVDAVEKPGIISECYRRFWNYSTGNQILAMFQCLERHLEPGPIHTFKGWLDLGRHVRKGEKAITLCMPVTVKRKIKAELAKSLSIILDVDGTIPATVFTYKPHWFVLSQTDGAEYVPQELPHWSESAALDALHIVRIRFDHPDGNCMGYAHSRSVAVSPLAPAKNVDETGWRRAGKFLWVAATRSLAVFHLDPCRNRDAMHELLGRKIKGTICTDRFGVYEKIPLARRGLCWSHLKRDFKDLAEQKGPAQRIGDAGLAVCARVFDLWQQFRERKISRWALAGLLMPVRRKMNRLLKQGIRSPAQRAARFCRELLRLEPALWTFGKVKGIEPTNNHAERMLRPAVMWRKQSLGSHSLGGCRFVERIMTALQTLRLRGQSVMDYLEQAIHALRCGVSPPPLLA